MSNLAIFGGPRAMDGVVVPEALFKWPILTEEDEAAVLDVLRRNAMSSTDITQQFEQEVAAWLGMKHAVGYCNGTLSVEAAMFGIGLSAGDEIICPTKTYWASCLSAASLGASVVFANIDPDTMCLDPNDLERCLSPYTKAIMVVHYFGHPADMDPIMAFARAHQLKVIEDVSHAQGGLYKGRRLGTIGDVGAMSMMSGKSFAAGEMGMLFTDDHEIYERALAYAHYERNNAHFITQTDALKRYYNMPLGGMKGRVNQMCAAMGRVQLKYYDERTAQIRKAMNFFWDQLEGVPGLRAVRVDEKEGSNMAGWYCPHGVYHAQEVGGLDERVVCEAIAAEIDFRPSPGGNLPLHTHSVFKDFDKMGLGKPQRIAFAHRDVRDLDQWLAPSERVQCLSVPWFKQYLPDVIAKYAEGYRKVLVHYGELLQRGQEEGQAKGRWYGTENR